MIGGEKRERKGDLTYTIFSNQLIFTNILGAACPFPRFDMPSLLVLP